MAGETDKGDMNKLMVDNALSALRDVKGAALVLFLDAMDDWSVWKDRPEKRKMILVTHREDSEKELEPIKVDVLAVLRLPPVNLTRLGRMKLAVIMAVTEGFIKNTDRIVCLTGMPRRGFLDTLMVLDLNNENEVFSTRGISRGLLKKIRPPVLETVLGIALELASEGREGKAIGTTFVIGGYDKVMKLSRPLIMNPFKGYPEEARNILDPALHETIKEFSLLDGAFVIREDGVVMGAGVHLDAALEGGGLLPGLGSRHMAAAGITDVTDAVAITISGSTGIVRVFRKGKVVLEIEKPNIA